jgi:hypothetical protein
MSRTVVSCCFLLALVCILEARSQDNGKIRTPPVGHNIEGNVEVTNFVRVLISPRTSAYSVTYDYGFPGETTVSVNGLGEVPASGSFHYLTTDKKLEFRDPSTGALLREVSLVETVVVAAPPPLTQIPSETEFQSAFRSFDWDSKENIQARANIVLGKYFHYLPRHDRGMTFIVTTFTPLQLQGAPRGVLGEAALLMSFPYDLASGRYDFHIQTLPMEGRDLSNDYRLTGNPAIVRAADLLVDSIVAEMKKGTRRP